MVYSRTTYKINDKKPPTVVVHHWTSWFSNAVRGLLLWSFVYFRLLVVNSIWQLLNSFAERLLAIPRSIWRSEASHWSAILVNQFAQTSCASGMQQHNLQHHEPNSVTVVRLCCKFEGLDWILYRNLRNGDTDDCYVATKQGQIHTVISVSSELCVKGMYMRVAKAFAQWIASSRGQRSMEQRGSGQAAIL